VRCKCPDREALSMLSLNVSDLGRTAARPPKTSVWGSVRIPGRLTFATSQTGPCGGASKRVPPSGRPIGDNVRRAARKRATEFIQQGASVAGSPDHGLVNAGGHRGGQADPQLPAPTATASPDLGFCSHQSESRCLRVVPQCPASAFG